MRIPKIAFPNSLSVHKESFFFFLTGVRSVSSFPVFLSHRKIQLGFDLIKVCVFFGLVHGYVVDNALGGSFCRYCFVVLPS